MKHEVPGILFLKLFSMTLASWVLTNYDKIAATFTSLVAGGYMLWKWYRDYNKAKHETTSREIQSGK